VKIEETGSLPLLENADVKKLLDVVLTWKFDIIALEDICKLQYVLLSNPAHVSLVSE